MIRIEDYSKMLAGEQAILIQQTEGLSHADSLIQPQPGGNCLNWVMGHLDDGLIALLKVCGGEKPDYIPSFDRYGYGSEPVVGDGEGVLPLQDLVASYEALTNAIIDRLAEMQEGDFDQETDIFSGKVTHGYAAFFFFFHISFHLGQLEFGRNLAGKTEKLI